MPTTFNTKCPPGSTAMAPASENRGTARAHTQLRRSVPSVHAGSGAARLAAVTLEYHEAPCLAPDDILDSLGLLPGRPRVLHVDPDLATAGILASLVVPEAQMVHAPTLAQARRLLATGVFSLVIIDPAMPDGDVRTLLPLLVGTPVLVYAAHQPEWRGVAPAFLPKPWTSPRQLWNTISGLLGIASIHTPGGA